MFLKLSRQILRGLALPLALASSPSLLGCGRPTVEPAAGAAGAPGPDGGAGSSGGATDGPNVVIGQPEAGAGEGPAAGDPGTCASESHMAQRVEVDLLLLVDVSSSMANVIAGGTQSKWQVAHAALDAFIDDAQSAGLGVGMQFFPLGASCALPDYARPAVAIGALPGTAAPLHAALAAQNVRLNFGTPTGAAVTGALDHLRTHNAANPQRRAVLVLVTDGEPTACTPLFIDQIAEPVTAAHTGAPSITTFVIGVFTPAELGRARGTVDRLAMAGGTTPFVLDANADLPRRLGEALQQVRNVAVPCEFVIPPPRKDTLDFGKVNLRFGKTAGQEDIPYVGSVDRCDPARGGWYYDVDPATGGRPTRVVVCDSTCKAFKTDPNAKVDLVFGCKTIVID